MSIGIARHRGVTFDSCALPGYGQLLATKVGLVVVVVALAAGHGAVARAATGCSVAGWPSPPWSPRWSSS